MTFKVKHVNEDWKEVKVDDWYYRYRCFAFRNYGDCEKLEEIELTEGVYYLDRQAFYGCKNLVRVILPHTLNEIRDLAFGQNDALKTYTIAKSKISNLI